MDIVVLLSGALIGFLVGLVGIGGGALMTPILILFFGVAPLVAVGTDLWFAAITKIFASRIHQKHELVDWQVVRRLWLGSLSASAATLLWIKLYPIDGSSTKLLTASIAFVVIFTAIGIVFQKRLHELGKSFRIGDSDRFKAIQTPLTILAGMALGVMVTLTSVGAGALGAVFLAYLYPFRLTPPRLIATDIVHAIPLALFAGVGHLFLGKVDFILLLNLLLGSIPAVAVGAMLSYRMSHVALRWILALVLMAVGLKLILE